MEMDGGNGQTGTRDHTSVDIDNEKVDIEDEKVDIEDEKATHEIVTDMKEKLQCVSRISEDRCIYRVPKSLRVINEAAYVPRLVSLGPFHHGNVNLKAMEEHKWRYFQSFIAHNNIDLDVLVRLMKKHEEKSRGFYAECIELPSAQFIKVMLVDAIFVINFLLETPSSCSTTPLLLETQSSCSTTPLLLETQSSCSTTPLLLETQSSCSTTPLLLETQSSCSTTSMISIYDEDFFRFQIFRDMLLLENQLPFFILQEILDFAKNTNGTTITEQRSITELTRSCINNTSMKNEGVTDLNGYEIMHFVDFLSRFYMHEKERRENCRPERKLERIKSMTELHKAGVRFKVAELGKMVLDIDFEEGVLKIPSIYVFDSTETIFRNLLAYDQCHYGFSYISDYFVLMGMLIDTHDDVELLVKNKILKNQLATNQEVSKVFNNLEKEVLFYEDSFYYSDLCHQINEFCKIPRHKWMANLKQNYLDTP